MNIQIEHLAPNCVRVCVGDSLVLAFSYETCVGFWIPEDGWVLSENVWGPTTGRHLNRFGPPHLRIDHSEFKERLEALDSRIEVNA